MSDFILPDDDSDEIPDLEDFEQGHTIGGSYAQELEAMMEAMRGPDGTGTWPGGLPVPASVSPRQVREQRAQHVAAIFRDYSTLQQILERHEATIQKRWQKKTKEQKRKILRSAWGADLPVTHRPDFEALRARPNSRTSSDPSSRSGYMWPYINQEDLTKPKTLLLFLNARGRNPPSDFAAADLEAMHIGLVQVVISPKFLNEYTMLFTGRTTEETYGQLISWDEHPDAFDWLHTRRHMQPGEGLLILEAQQRTMQFLVDCAKQIMHDMDDGQLLAAQIQPPPPSITESDTGLASLASLAAERPYRVPSQMQMSRIESLLSATRDAAEDHMWAMREDPSYFAHTMTESFNHRQELVKDYYGKLHPLFDAGREDLMWGRVISEEVITAFIRLELWNSLYEQAVRLRELQDQHGPHLDPEKDLPEEYLMAILKFHHALESFAKGPIGQLKVSLVASEPFRPHCTRQPETRPTATQNIVEIPRANRLGPIKLQILWLMKLMWEGGQNLFLAKLTNVMDELQRLIDTEAEAKNSITAYVAVQIGDMSAICECLRQLEAYQPWANMYEEHAVSRKDSIEEDYLQSAKPWARLLDATKGSNDVLARHGTPAGSRFNYPISKRRSRDNVEAMRSAEQNLDLFWHKVDELIHRNAGDLTGTATRKLMLQPRILQRTPEWIEPDKAKGGKESKDPLANMAPSFKPLSEIYFDLERRTEITTTSSSGLRAGKSKQKTRGVPSAQSVTEAEAIAKPNPADPQPTFAVDNRALKVFNTLFYTPSAGATPGDVAWTDFLHAMVETGFRAEKLYGSVWQFSPSRLDVERSIQFHEPHPTGKIPYWIARRHGRRLNRAYGWFGGMFELAKKAVAG